MPGFVLKCRSCGQLCSLAMLPGKPLILAPGGVGHLPEIWRPAPSARRTLLARSGPVGRGYRCGTGRDRCYPGVTRLAPNGPLCVRRGGSAQSTSWNTDRRVAERLSTGRLRVVDRPAAPGYGPTRRLLTVCLYIGASGEVVRICRGQGQAPRGRRETSPTPT